MGFTCNQQANCILCQKRKKAVRGCRVLYFHKGAAFLAQHCDTAHDLYVLRRYNAKTGWPRQPSDVHCLCCQDQHFQKSSQVAYFPLPCRSVDWQNMYRQLITESPSRAQHSPVPASPTRRFAALLCFTFGIWIYLAFGLLPCCTTQAINSGFLDIFWFWLSDRLYTKWLLD